MIKLFQQFLKFGLVGVLNTLIGYIIYSALVMLQFHYMLANCIAFVVGLGNSFYWNNKYVFKRKENHSAIRVLLKMGIVYGITGILLQTILLYTFIEKVHISAYIAPVFCLFVTVPVNFFLNKVWAFGETTHE